MVKETIESAANDQRLENPILPSLPRNIASVPKLEKTVVIPNQLSRFENCTAKTFDIFSFIVYSV